MNTHSSLQVIQHPLFKHHQLCVAVKRDDLLHPIISGNKWRKLKYNLIEAKKLNKTNIISFGGAYSNHIHALAFACKQHGLQSIGIIRGEPEYADNFTLRWAQYWGMKLIFVDRKTYQKRHQQNYLEQLQQQFPDSFIVPEGGSNSFALPGVAEICYELESQIDYHSLLLPVGSGGTLAGLVVGDKGQHDIIGIGVLKQGINNKDYLSNEVKTLLPQTARNFSNWKIMGDLHRGGYAKFSQIDCERIQAFIKVTKIPFEPVYSGKMLLACLDLIEQGYFAAGSKIVLLHTGGLQGLGGLAERRIIKATQWSLPSAAQVR